jgi:hypothetical protein
MQLCTAALQLSSSVVQHVGTAPKKQRRLAQQKAVGARLLDVVHHQYQVVTAAQSLMIIHTSPAALLHTQLHLSPHYMPYLASLLVVHANWLCSSYRSGSLQAARRCSSNSESNIPTTIQLHLFHMLGMSPALVIMTGPLQNRADVISHLNSLLAACAPCYNAAALLCSAQEQQTEAEQQRCQFEQQLWRLLPSVLLAGAKNLLLVPVAGRATDPLQQQQQQHQHQQRQMEECVFALLEQSGKALITYSRLHRRFGGDLSHDNANAWMQEILGVVLQLADQLLLQQQPQDGLQGQAAAAVPSTDSQLGSSMQASSGKQPAPASSGNINGAVQQNSNQTRKSCAAELLALLSTLVYESDRWFLSGSSTLRRTPEPIPVSIKRPDCDAKGSVATPTRTLSSCQTTCDVPPGAERFVEVCTALEAGLRAVTSAVQSGSLERPPTLITFCLHELLIGDDDGDRGALESHIGILGPAAAVLELQRFYSMLSTVQKMSHCRAGSGKELCWGRQVADTCCWVAAQAAVGLLQAPMPSGSKAAAVAAVEVQQQIEEMQYLPSLVIFGRCCLNWAEGLNHDMLLLPPTTEVQQPEQGGVREEHSAAHVCIPGWQQAAAAAASAPCRLERLMATVSSWVGGVTSQAVQAALAAAAGGHRQVAVSDLQHFR